MNGYDIETVVARLDERVSPRTETGDVVAPIHLTTTHEMHSPDEADHDYKYTRFGNPTRDVLENRLARITGSEYAFACSSGTTAMATTCLSLLESGAHVVAFEGIYGGHGSSSKTS